MAATKAKNPKTIPDEKASNLVKDPGDWVTGDEAMTGAQASYLKTLSEEAHEPFDGNLTKAEASERIERMQEKAGRVSSAARGSRPARRRGRASG